MAAPTTWSTPASGADLGGTDADAYVNHAGAYWFAISRVSFTTVKIRSASDATGTWTQGTMPTAPTGYTTAQSAVTRSGVVSDGTTYAFPVRYVNSGGLVKFRIVYATDPTGTWSSFEFDTSDLYRPSFMAYDGTQWILTGTYVTGTPNPGFIAYCSTLTGTWTFNTSSATTGYDAAALGLGNLDITNIAFDGTTYVTSADTASGDSKVRCSTSLTSSWAEPSTPPTTNFTNVSWLRYHANGYWTLIGSSNNIHYASDPTGTWTNLTSTDTGMTRGLEGVAWDNGYWVIVGSVEESPGVDDPRLAYLAGSGAPSGSFTTVASDGFTDPGGSTDFYGISCDVHQGMFVAGASYLAQVRYCFVEAATGPTLLRQRQSPLRSPARVRGVDLRQRQTPFVT